MIIERYHFFKKLSFALRFFWTAMFLPTLKKVYWGFERSPCFLFVSTMTVPINTKVSKWSSRISYLFIFLNFVVFRYSLICFENFKTTLEAFFMKQFFCFCKQFILHNTFDYSHTCDYIYDLYKVRTKSKKT